MFWHSEGLKDFINKLGINLEKNIIYEGYDLIWYIDFLVCTVENKGKENIASIYCYTKIENCSFFKKIKYLFISDTVLYEGNIYRIEKLKNLYVLNINQKVKFNFSDYLKYKKYGL